MAKKNLMEKHIETTTVVKGKVQTKVSLVTLNKDRYGFYTVAIDGVPYASDIARELFAVQKFNAI